MNATPSPTTNAKSVPEWAIDRALEHFPNPYFVSGDSWKSAVMEGRDMPYANAVRFLASQIAEHEEAPVDPLLIEAREICATVAKEVARHEGGSESADDWATQYRSGLFDGDNEMNVVLAALRAREAS